jgi:hypothetical protein
MQQFLPAEELFKDRKMVIATKHGKEQVIAPSFERALGVKCMVSEGFDTDILGTFSGEVERETDPVTAAREKCRIAMELTGCDIALASEGSFGPHPSYFFVSSDEEFLMFFDRKNNIEILVKEISTDTNFNGSAINSKEELFEFAQKVGFPEHALILRKSKDDFSGMVKGISDPLILKETFENLIEKYAEAYAETDMRAMHNPTRMRVIGKAVEKLISKIKSACPACNMPGFGITDVKKGLPCGLCGSPTRSILSYICACKNCAFVKEELFPNEKLQEDPMYCDRCNP